MTSVPGIESRYEVSRSALAGPCETAGGEAQASPDTASKEPADRASRRRPVAFIARRPKNRRLAETLAFGLVYAASNLAAQEVRREFVELHMGMPVRIVLYAGQEPMARTAAAAAFARIEGLEDIMSDYRSESEIRRLAGHSRIWVPVSPELYAVLARAIEIAERSEGAFDPTVGPYVTLWREARRSGRFPPRPELDSAGARVGWHAVHLDADSRSVMLDIPGMALDLGGIAKGYILDQALAELRRQGVTRALLEAGGDIVVGDPPPGATGWRVQVSREGTPLATRAAALANAAVSTSGDLEQFAIIEGVRYSHVVDPRTGLGLTNGLQATVIADDGMTADALATALTVLEAEGRARLLAWFPGALAVVGR